MVTVITKTIGSGKDFPDFTTAEAAVPTIVGGTDLVAADTAVVFEADAGTYNESVTLDGALVTDATRNVTYKAAAGSEHGGVAGQGVHLVNTGVGSTLTLHDAHTVVEGLSATNPNGFTLTFVLGCDGSIARRCIVESTAVTATASAVFYGPNSAGTTITIQDSVIKTSGTAYGIRGKFNCNMRIRNCTLQASLGAFVETLGRPSSIELLNNLSIGPSYSQTGGGVVTLTGSNNFGEDGGFPWPVSVAGTPATITASTAYDPGAGDFALYVGKNGALLDSPNNDVIGGGVGPSVNSDVPTTDILGNARSGALANPGAFEVPQAPTVITRTIGEGRDYISFTDAEADVENIGGSADLVFENERIVFEADAGTYNESVSFVSSLTTDATRNVTCKPAAGSEHGGSPDSGVILNKSGNTGQALRILTPYTVLRGLVVLNQYGNTANYGIYIGPDGHGSRVENCIVKANGLFAAIAEPPAFDTTAAQPAAVFKNNSIEISVPGAGVFRALELRGAAANDCYMEAVNNTLITDAGARAVQVGVNSGASTTASYLLTNNLVIGLGVVDTYTASGSGTKVVTGSNNFGGSTSPFPVAIQGSPYPITASTSYDPGAGDYALYVASNGALLDSPNNDVIGQGLSFLNGAGDVPGYDIQGNPRGAKISNPGAFEIPQGPTVVTKTIGEGRDYISFTDAEADVENIATLEFGSTDLAANNGAIVFEADAGVYNENVQILNGLTVDATRNITFIAAAGAEHGGSSDSGVILNKSGNTSYALWSRLPHTVLRGLVVLNEYGAANNYGVWVGVDGYSTRIEDCIIKADGLFGIIVQPPTTFDTTTALPAAVVKNNLVKVSSSASNAALELRGSSSNDSYTEAVNNTLICEDNATGIDVGSTGGAGTTHSYELTNNLVLGSGAYKTYNQAGSGTWAPSGSNNFGNNTSPFPAALQGSPYPVTATTDTDPGPGDWAIYDAATGALIDDPDNDVLGGGVGPDADADVPTTDILGNIRSGDTTDPGAFQRPALDTIMRQIYQQDAPFAIGASPSGVSGITHQPGPAALDYFTINSTTSATITVPRTAHAMRIVCAIAAKACDVTLELDASNSVYLGTIGGVASVQADIDYFWSFASVASDGAYPRVKIEYDGVFSGDQLVYLWWHLA